MKTRIAVTVFAVLLISASMSAAPDPVEEKAVLATLDKMVQATVAKDAAALNALYHEDVIFCHSNGLVQNKAELIKGVVERKGGTDSITFEKVTVKIFGTSALVKNYTHMHNAGETTNIDLDALWVLSKGPQGWQIVSRHVNRITPAAK